MPSTTPPPFYGHTNVSRPQLQHSLSTRSVTASEDYYSAASDVSISPAPVTKPPTPPSQYRTPMASREQLPSDRASFPGPMRGGGRRRYTDPQRDPLPNPLGSNPRVPPIIRKPLPHSYYDTTSSGSNQQTRRSPSDNTPFIHFALDQLTRDDALHSIPSQERAMHADDRGSIDTVRPQQGSVSPISPILAGTSLSSVPAHVLPGTGEHDARVRPPPLAIVTSDIDSHPFGLTGRESPVSPLESAESASSRASTPRNLARESAEAPSFSAIPPRNPARESAVIGPRGANSEALIPIEPPTETPHLALNTLPLILQPLPLVAFTLALALFIGVLAFTAIRSLSKEHLLTYGHFGDGRYFLFEYLPLIVSIAALLWLFEIETALYRVSPFIALASDGARVRIDVPFLPLQPSGFFIPSLGRLTTGQPAVACFFIASWMSLFTIPLLAASYNVHQSHTGTWYWVATQGAIWVAIALYLILLTCSLWLVAFLWKTPTGLKWDATSLADLLVLLEASNVLDLYASCFYSSPRLTQDREDLVARDVRLGYWKTSTRANARMHTIGAPGQSTRRYSVINGQLVEDSTINRYRQSTDVESGRPYSYGTVCSLLSKRFSRQLTEVPEAETVYRPFILRPVIGALLIITFFSLLIAFLVVSYLPATAIQSGFNPDLPIPVNNDGFSAANFLYSFVPSLLGLLMFLLWTHIDLTLRRLQPIANLKNPRGATAESSLLLSYTSDGPGLVTLKALINGDYRVAIVSSISLLSAALPILGGGVFWAEFYIPTQTVRIYGNMPAFHALTAIFSICCLGFLALPVLPRHSEAYAVPSPADSHRANHARSLADVIALVHQSKLLVDHTFHGPETRTQLVTRLLTVPGSGALVHLPGNEKKSASKISLADSIRGFGDARGGQKSADDRRYRLGRFTGRDGRSHFGIDRASRITDGGAAGKGREKSSAV